jgi:hypothetical protein
MRLWSTATMVDDDDQEGKIDWMVSTMLIYKHPRPASQNIKLQPCSNGSSMSSSSIWTSATSRTC